MSLSVVIVNYNVKHFINQCLRSVYEAAEELKEAHGMETEVWVVDNNSTDGSVQMIREKHPSVRLIANSDNPGFAKANNQAIREILTENGERKTKNGDYVLLLNPDTLVQKDTFTTCINFYRHHPDCGGLSVKMINGEGQYLKESKRGFPSPATSFYKISGLIKLFPHNKKVAAYYMGHLDDDKTNEVDVLPGAFLMISREALEKTGLLDESYFMYGEDIDFSWRIKLAGYKNYYLPTTRILHYKGESTRKSSMNYVYTFYNAMAIFARKYFNSSGAKSYSILIQLAIWLRASLDFIKRIASRLAVPALDFIVSLGGFLAIKQVWATYWAENVNYYPNFYTWTILPLYVLILLLASFLAGGYDKPVRVGRIAKGMAVGTLCLLVFYSLLGEELRFSRVIVLLGSVWSILATMGIRGILNLMNVEGYRITPGRHKRYLVVGSGEECDRLEQLFDSLGIDHNGIFVATDANDPALHSQLQKVDEVIFCSRDIPVSRILDIMQQNAGSKAVFRILPAGMEVLIGSNYTSSPEELYTPDFGNIDNVTNRRSKRVFDIVSSLLLIMLSPLLFWPQQRKKRYFADCFSVLSGRKSWVGYSNSQFSNSKTPLPNIKKGVFKTRDRMPKVKNPNLGLLDENYATNYNISTDFSILIINLLKI
ncbi:MAG: glycosyltransferase [Bacteroidales bacterium]|nr:glycosyltransferase [Bacteroidales bacterium]